MKKILIILIICIVSSCNEKEASDLVKALENSFISGKDSSILKCYPNKDEFEEIYEIMKNNTDSDDLITADSLWNSFRSNAVEGFGLILQAGRDSNITWKDLTIVDFQIEPSEQKYKEIKEADVSVRCSSRDRTFTIYLKCIFIASNWKIEKPIGWIIDPE
jgi:hypothetical protein